MKLPNLRNPVTRTDSLSKTSKKVAFVAWVVGKR
jgi:hypothetical protein